METATKYFTWLGLFAGIYLIVFYFVPSSIEHGALVYDKFFQGELWRLGTYQFAHLNATHLYENLVGFLLIVLIALEVKVDFQEMSTIYVLTGMIAVLPIWFFVQSTVLGASAAIYGGFGMHSMEVEKYGVSTSLVASVVFLVIFAKPVVSLIVGDTAHIGSHLLQAVLHGAGMIFGFVLYGLVKRYKPLFTQRRIRCLRTIERMNIE